MRKISRREFLEDTMFTSALAFAAATRSTAPAADEAPKKVGALERLRVATIGVNGQGGSHLGELLKIKEVDIVAICDVDPAAFAKRSKMFKERIPEYVQDIRKLLERKDIDAVTIATPNHWHALAAIWALQAGKDVYVEKPVSHNVSEGRRIVEVARKLNRICQTGTQSRSMTGMKDMLAFIHSGKIGKVTIGRGYCYKVRNSIGKAKAACPTPEGLDLDLWLGPAPKAPIMRQKFHYDWHWQWAYGNGDLGNQGIHEMDKARWGINKNELPKRAFSFGGRFGYIDDGETANTQLCFYDWGEAQVLFEVRGLKNTTDFYKGKMPGRSPRIGNIWYGSDGFVVSADYQSGIAFDRDGNIINKFAGGNYVDHFQNFIKAIRSRKHEDLAADIEQGHISSALCHLGNVSYRLGKPQPFDATPELIKDRKDVVATYEQIKEHLQANDVKLSDVQMTVGADLTLDPKTETTTSAEANKLLTREYRKGFEVPAKV
jgi:predicted dehydrogenase